MLVQKKNTPKNAEPVWDTSSLRCSPKAAARFGVRVLHLGLAKPDPRPGPAGGHGLGMGGLKKKKKINEFAYFCFQQGKKQLSLSRADKKGRKRRKKSSFARARLGVSPRPPRGGSVFLAGSLAWEGSAVKTTQERRPDTLINILN